MKREQLMKKFIAIAIIAVVVVFALACNPTTNNATSNKNAASTNAITNSATNSSTNSESRRDDNNMDRMNGNHSQMGDQHRSNGMKMGEVLPILRIALAGTMQGPAIFDMAAYFGRDETLRRLNRAFEAFDNFGKV